MEFRQVCEVSGPQAPFVEIFVGVDWGAEDVEEMGIELAGTVEVVEERIEEMAVEQSPVAMMVEIGADAVSVTVDRYVVTLA